MLGSELLGLEAAIAFQTGNSAFLPARSVSDPSDPGLHAPSNHESEFFCTICQVGNAQTLMV